LSKNWVIWLEELDREDNDLVGKKCANLGEMTKMGLKVPPGFALSVDAYRDFMDMTGAIEEIRKYLARAKPENITQFKQSSADIRQILQSKAIPKEMEKTIVSYYMELCRRCTTEAPVSTRSSGPSSHPGQYETYLNVVGELNLVDKIKKVWASTFNPRSLAFRSRNKLSLVSDPIGVAVLKMVDARAAGVIFTADPNTGNTRRMIIEANWGLGESVVSGDSTPDVYILDKEGPEIKEKKLGPKCRYVTIKEVGVAEEELPPEKTDQFCLSDDEAREIGRLGKVLEEHFGKPQDAEWAVEEGVPLPESIISLQTRPEIIAKTKPPVDKIVDLMLDRISKGVGFEGIDM